MLTLSPTAIGAASSGAPLTRICAGSPSAPGSISRPPPNATAGSSAAGGAAALLLA